MSTDNTITKTDLKNILEEIGNIGGSSDATPTPTANATAAFDSSAHMNSEDMSSSDVSNFIDGLNTTVGDYIQRDELADYIVEQGTSGIWTYRKWNSGIAECWGLYTNSSITFTAATGAAGGYRANATGINFPFTFASAPLVTATHNGTSSDYYGVVSNVYTTTSYFSIWLDRGNSATGQIKVHIRVTGRWK